MSAAQVSPPRRAPLVRWPGVAGFAAFGALLLAAPLVLPDFRLVQMARYLCLAIVAVGIALAWGRGGMLVLGQGVFFGLGGYAMGMHLKLAEVAPGQLPDFMVWSGVSSLPAIWRPFANPAFALAMVVVLPVTLAVILGLLLFRQRVRGAYFAVLSSAMAGAFVILLVGQQGLTGGTNGLTNIGTYFGFQRFNPTHQRGLYYVVVAVLAVMFLVAWQLAHSRFGRLLVAIRDGEDRVRFLGYDPAVVKTVAYAVAAGMAGIAGALYVPVVGIFSPTQLDVVPSIAMVIAVAIGGRYSLVGAVAGAILVNLAETRFSERFEDMWPYLLGGLFIAVMLWAPRGLAGLVADTTAAIGRRVRPPQPPPGAVVPAPRPVAEVAR